MKCHICHIEIQRLAIQLAIKEFGNDIGPQKIFCSIACFRHWLGDCFDNWFDYQTDVEYVNQEA